MTTFAPGDKVTVEGRWSGIVWTVDRKLSKNYLLRAEGQPRGLRCAPELMTKFEGGELPAPSYAQLLAEIHYVGATVTVRGREGIWVVLRDLPNGGYSVVKLGGDGGRYLRCPSASSLTAVTVEAKIIEKEGGSDH